MKLDQLRIFLTVAEVEHVTLASQRLNLTQSAVTGAIQALEQTHQVALFDRVGRGIRLNSVGRAFREKARAVLHAVEEAEALLGDLNQLSRGHLVIHASQTITSHWLPRYLVEFRTRHPGVTLEARVGNTRQCLAALMEGHCDLAFVEGAFHAPLVDEQVVAIDHLAIICAPGHALAGSHWQGLAQLTGWPLILREAGSGTRSTFDEAIVGAGLASSTLEVALELWSNEAICSAVAQSDHIGVVPWIVCEPLVHTGKLCALKANLVERPFRVLHHRQRHLSAAAKEFRNLLAGPVRGTADQA